MNNSEKNIFSPENSIKKGKKIFNKIISSTLDTENKNSIIRIKLYKTPSSIEIKRFNNSLKKENKSNKEKFSDFESTKKNNFQSNFSFLNINNSLFEGNKENLNHKKIFILNQIKNLNEKIKNNKIKIQNYENNLKDNKNIKENLKREIENNLSNKESLEEIYKEKLNEINENKNNININPIEIKIEDIKNLNTNKFQNQLFNLNNVLFEKKDKNFFILKYKNNVLNFINKIKSNFFQKNNSKNFSIDIINIFINLINELFGKIKPSKKIYLDKIIILIKYITKINSIDNQIEKDLNYIKKDYKSKKNDIKLIISDLTKYNLELNRQIEDFNNFLKDIEIYIKQFETKEIENGQKKIKFFSKNEKKISKSLPKEMKNLEENLLLNDDEPNILFKKIPINKYHNSSKSNNFHLKSTSLGNSFVNSIQSTIKKNTKNFTYRSSSSGNLISQTPVKNLNNTRINFLNKSLLNSNTNTKKKNNNFNDENDKISEENFELNSCNITESFCYFKIWKKNNNDIKKFNPLKHYLLSPEDFGYLKGFISINFTNNFLEFIPHQIQNNLNKNIFKNKLSLDIKKIHSVNISLIMQNIIKVHKIFLKYNKNNIINFDEKNLKKHIFSINKIIHLRELNNINLENNDKIKAALSHYFTLNINYDNNEKLECIFINFEEYNNWVIGLKMISEKNKNNIEKKDLNIFKKISGKHRKTNSSNSLSKES